jgi:hypothetical protein
VSALGGTCVLIVRCMGVGILGTKRHKERGREMARQRKPEYKHHIFRMIQPGRKFWKEAQCVLIGPGTNTYLWVGPSDESDGSGIFTFSGPKTLRALAFAILDATGGRKESE